MNQLLQHKPLVAISILFLARLSTEAHSLLHMMEQEGLTIDLHLLTKAPLSLLKNKSYDWVVIDADTENVSGELIKNFLSQFLSITTIAIISKETIKNRLLALSYGAEMLYVQNTDISEMKLMLSNLISRHLCRNKKNTQIEFLNTQPKTVCSSSVGEDWFYHKSGNLITHSNNQYEINLTMQEGILLQTLISNQGEYVNREHLFASLGNRDWNYNDRTVDVLISRLRKKISKISTKTDALQSRYGSGYRLKPLVEHVSE